MVKRKRNKAKNKEAAATLPAAPPAAPPVKQMKKKGKIKEYPETLTSAPQSSTTVKPTENKGKNKEPSPPPTTATAVDTTVAPPVGKPVPTAEKLNPSKIIQKPMRREQRAQDAIFLAGGPNFPAKKTKKKNEKEEEEECPGFLFLCSSRTKQECFRHGVFGMPLSRAELVKMIKPEMRLFLFDTSQKILYGIYRASSEGGMGLVPEAFGGGFPAQVRFRPDIECLPLPEIIFKQAILENYDSNKFQPYLSSVQVKKLEALFQPITAAPLPASQHLENRHVPSPAPLPSSTEPYRSAHIPPAYLPQPEERYAPPCAPLPPTTEPPRTAHVPPAYLPQLESRHVPHYAPLPSTSEQYRAAHIPPYLPATEESRAPPPARLPPTTEPPRSAHIPPSYFPQLESRHVSASAPIPETIEPYRSAHIAPASLPPLQDLCRPSTHQTPSHLPPAEDQYRFRTHLISHLPPSTDPYLGHASKYISAHIPSTSNDLHHPTTNYVRTADPYYPPPSSSIYRPLEAAHAYFPENSIPSDCSGYRVFLETVEDPNALLSRDCQSLHRKDGNVVPQANQIDSGYLLDHVGANSTYERLPLTSYLYDSSLYMQGHNTTDAHQRQPSSSMPVSSRYSFAGAAPVRR